MARPGDKKEMIEAANSNFEKLWSLIESMPEESLNTEFDFSDDKKKKEAHWQRDKNLRDVLIHLYEWHQLLLKWVKSNLSGDPADFLPAPYTWKTYGDMNIEFWKKHQNTSLESSERLVKSSHKEVIEMVQTFSDEELFTKKYFDWTGTTSLGSYCVSALSSHYDWAIKKLKAHAKKFS
ncbi:ClbS/DfsB family four-helix bundle protein [Marinobacter sp. CHS3-4]|uniref:ClbS/DfsB family four-helix bundle protein n=1 Tax=Marinobacter sp. CHS3-4 TaxID=3045174 RepID=UPI0024B53B69|nr:ClbS/DfsB family four-helix bundle protein [Marinobacter sp. CHS3-4]MDI9246439.1 ClbS/DfsB family four-helix bundle protein [Marinobacter sp. CHS3-4]